MIPFIIFLSDTIKTLTRPLSISLSPQIHEYSLNDSSHYIFIWHTLTRASVSKKMYKIHLRFTIVFGKLDVYKAQIDPSTGNEWMNMFKEYTMDSWLVFYIYI